MSQKLRIRRKVLVKHAGESRLLRYADLDLRSIAGKEYRARVEALTAHLGGDLTAPQARLVDMAARLALLASLAWDELTRAGAFKDGEPRPALSAYRSAIADERSVLAVLGIERKAKPVPTVEEYLQAKAREHPALRLKGEGVSDAEEVE
jgi:hypothetical protein